MPALPSASAGCAGAQDLRGPEAQAADAGALLLPGSSRAAGRGWLAFAACCCLTQVCPCCRAAADLLVRVAGFRQLAVACPYIASASCAHASAWAMRFVGRSNHRVSPAGTLHCCRRTLSGRRGPCWFRWRMHPLWTCVKSAAARQRRQQQRRSRRRRRGSSQRSRSSSSRAPSGDVLLAAVLVLCSIFRWYAQS